MHLAAHAAGCTLALSNLSFGTYVSSTSNGANTATVNCPNGTKYSIGFNAGTSSGATTSSRKLTGPNGATLNYSIYQDAARTVNWGNNTGTDTVSGTGTGANQVYNIYSQIPAGQLPQPGTYTDTISTSTENFSVSATMQATCSLSVTSLQFGTYTGQAVNSTSTLTVACTNTTGYTIGIGAGSSTGATSANRAMTASGGNTLSYALFSDSTRTTNWGDTSNTVSGTGNGSKQSLTIYGVITGGQYRTPGSYTDIVNIILTY